MLTQRTPITIYHPLAVDALTSTLPLCLRYTRFVTRDTLARKAESVTKKLPKHIATVPNGMGEVAKREVCVSARAELFTAALFAYAPRLTTL